MSHITYLVCMIPKVLLLEIMEEKDLPKNFFTHYHTHLYCHTGHIRFLFNDQEMNCKGGQFLFWFAGTRVSGLHFSRNCKASVLLAEKDFLMENIPDQGWSINALLHSRVYPVKNVPTLRDKRKILSNFKNLNARFLETDHRFYEEALKLQMKLFVLDMWHTFANEYEQRKHSFQTGTLYERFISFLAEYCMQQREVRFYSSRLNISPKYLNHLCKIHSGIRASEWIKRYTRERIIILLQNRNLNISEIADEMEFSSRSFFTRYVKKILGVTPGEYRKRME